MMAVVKVNLILLLGYLMICIWSSVSKTTNQVAVRLENRIVLLCYDVWMYLTGLKLSQYHCLAVTIGLTMVVGQDKMIEDIVTEVRR